MFHVKHSNDENNFNLADFAFNVGDDIAIAGPSGTEARARG
jgi:hypothetical protein